LAQSLKERLLSKVAFQGARHELKVAAVGVSAGFEIEFENDKNNKISHAEYIGTDKDGTKIAVEAKSRHRFGVHGFEGGKQVEPGASANLRDIILDAYKKKTALPLYAFIDANLPSASSQEQLDAWFKEICDTMVDLDKEGYTEPCPTNVLFVCNDPSHYVGDRHIDNMTDGIWLLDFEATIPRVPHPATNVRDRLKLAFDQRTAPPDEIPDF
jgi:hypothetical protein